MTPDLSFGIIGQIRVYTSILDFLTDKHSTISPELIEHNRSLIAKLLSIIPEEKNYILENLDEFYREFQKKYFHTYGIELLKPVTVLLGENYSNELNEIVKTSLDEF